MTDAYGRKIEYLRLSVTDLCSLRCIYCMHPDGVTKKSHGEILSIEELYEIAHAAYTLGIRKIRLTGGEPLVRRGILRLCEMIRSLGDDVELTLTTNGCALKALAKPLKKAGVSRLNISLDTLDPEKYRRITRIGSLDDALEGLYAAHAAGFRHTKINTVLIGGINDDEIEALAELTRDHDYTVRFIELMPMGVCSGWNKERFIPSSSVPKRLPSLEYVGGDGVSTLCRLPGHRGMIGLISPLSYSFCDNCNKIRVTADGRLKPCLHSKEEISLKGLCGDALLDEMRRGILLKPPHHTLSEGCSSTPRHMNEIGG